MKTNTVEKNNAAYIATGVDFGLRVLEELQGKQLGRFPAEEAAEIIAHEITATVERGHDNA